MSADSQVGERHSRAGRPHWAGRITASFKAATLALVPEPATRTREFGRREASADPVLEELLGLGRWLGDDLDAAIALSDMTGSRIRDLFVAGVTDIQTIPCLSGLDLEADVSDIYAATAALGRLQEDADFEAFMALVRPGAVIVDVGANFGVYAAHAALHAGPEGRVFAFEPAPGAFELLQSNILRNDLAGRSMAVRAAVGASDGTAPFCLKADVAFSGLRDTGRSRTLDRIEVEVRSLDGFEPLADRAVDLIKIDTEGGEAGVLAGAGAVLARSPDVIVMFECCHKNLDAAARADLIGELHRLTATGLGLHARGSDGATLVALGPDELVGPRSENLFLVRPASAAHAALAAAIAAPRRAPTLAQATALEILRRHGRYRTMHKQLCHRIVDAGRRALGPELGSDPMLAAEQMADRLLAVADRDPQPLS